MAVAVSSKSKTASTTGTGKRRSTRRSKPSDDEIRILAYRLYERRQADGTEGDAASDWIEAERRLAKN